VDFNQPITTKNHKLGQCSGHDQMSDFSSIPNRFLFPNTIDPFSHSDRIDDRNARFIDPACAPHDTHIGIEDPLKALQFGDYSDSYATINLGRKNQLKNRFNITFSFRTLYPNGMFIQGIVSLFCKFNLTAHY